MGAKRKAQNLNIPIKLGNNIFFAGIDSYPGSDPVDEAMILSLEKDDGTVINFKGAMPELTYITGQTLTLTLTFTKV